jgi:hypothetical protein
MTRKTRREIARDLDELDDDNPGDTDGDDSGITVVYEDADTGDYYRTRDGDGDPVDLDSFEGLVVKLERREAGGR